MYVLARFIFAYFVSLSCLCLCVSLHAQLPPSDLQKQTRRVKSFAAPLRRVEADLKSRDDNRLETIQTICFIHVRRAIRVSSSEPTGLFLTRTLALPRLPSLSAVAERPHLKTVTRVESDGFFVLFFFLFGRMLWNYLLFQPEISVTCWIGSGSGGRAGRPLIESLPVRFLARPALVCLWAKYLTPNCC